MGDTWRQLAAEAQRHRDDTLASLQNPIPHIHVDEISLSVIDTPRKYLNEEEIEITETPLRELINALATGRLTASAATNAFLRRAAIAQKLLVPEEALARAKELDEHLAKTGKVTGPFHGLPVSIKARTAWKGLKRTEGFVGFLKETYEEDASLLDILRKLGAVPYVRTTEPQGLMMLECISNVHGSTTNPYNTALTPGGSSGGEGAILALLGSPFGIGGDIGGSLRSPAANCGIYTLKPTTKRVPARGLKLYMSGSESIFGTPGVMSPYIEGVSLFMKYVLGTRPWETDPALATIPWREYSDPFGPTLNIGVMWDDGFVKPSKSMTRALRQVVGKLQKNPRFKITNWEPYKTAEGMEILNKLYSPDGGNAFQKHLQMSGEPWLELTSYRCRTGPGVENLSMQELWDWTTKRERFRFEYLRALDMHMILCPPHHGPAQPIGTTRYWGYTSIFNLLDYPAAVFPVTQVEPTLDREDDNYTPRNEFDAWAHQHYDAEKQRGAPVGLQLVGRRMEDEKVVMAMHEVCEAAGILSNQEKLRAV